MKRRHLSMLWTLFVCSLFASALLVSCNSQPVDTAATPAAPPPPNGEKLVLTLGCHDCHTPMKMGEQGPEADMARMLSGHPQEIGPMIPPTLPPDSGWMWVGNATNTAYAGPWGVSYSANLTPDETTGLGAWTEEWFVNSIRKGLHMGSGRPIMPPMPWQVYSHLDDAELKAIFAYLKTIPPIKNEVPPYSAPGE